MERDTLRMRGERPWTFSNLKSGEGLEKIIAFLEERNAADVASCPVTLRYRAKNHAAGNSANGQRGRTVTPRSAVAPALKRTMPA